jgi:hypothetical protein
MSDVVKIYQLYVESADANEQPKMRMNDNGDKMWYLHNELHRENAPAIEYADGTKEWYLHGKRHRENAPAVEYANGIKMWWLHGKLHRDDGAAIEWKNGDKMWYLHGKEYRDADAWAQATLKHQNKMHNAEAVQKFLRTILMKDDLI